MELKLKVAGDELLLEVVKGPHGTGAVLHKGFAKSPIDPDTQQALEQDEEVCDLVWNSVLNALESLLLSHASNGINIGDAQYLEGFETALTSLAYDLT